MITFYTTTIRHDSADDKFTATLSELPSGCNADELEGTGETVAEALHDLAEQCEGYAV